MSQGTLFFVGFIVMTTFIAALAWLVAFVVARSEAHESLGQAMSDRDINEVKAVLAARGHLLRKAALDAANAWIAEQETEGAV